jgi:DNA-binding NarL/FixJ family response regulator
MKFIEIARLTNRKESTVWTGYRNAVKKKKPIIKVKESLLVPINIFTNRKFSVLEALVKHLKDKGFRNFEIAELIGKDQRNIGVLYSRAKKKLGKRK